MMPKIMHWLSEATIEKRKRLITIELCLQLGLLRANRSLER